MTRKFWIALAATASLTASAIGANAQAPAPVNTKPAAVQAGSYVVETYHTRVQFAVNHMGFSDWYGDFTGVTGTLNLDPAAPAKAAVDIVFPTGSVTTTNAKLDEELRGPKWFDAGTHANIRFTSTKVVPLGNGKARITGNLMFHGVVRPVVLEASFVGSGTNMMSKAYTVGFNATTQIKRSDFGVTTYVPMIGDLVNIRISAAFERKGA